MTKVREKYISYLMKKFDRSFNTVVTEIGRGSLGFEIRAKLK